jgi:hypothetical protein
MDIEAPIEAEQEDSPILSVFPDYSRLADVRGTLRLGEWQESRVPTYPGAKRLTGAAQW